MSFPPGSVEATAPLMMKRRKHTKADVQPVEGWRLVMSLRSGLLMESTWALDVINVLLYDDHAVSYFGLGNMPGLIEALLEHWRATLIAMFEITQELELSTKSETSTRIKKAVAQIKPSSETSGAQAGASQRGGRKSRKRRRRRDSSSSTSGLFAEASDEEENDNEGEDEEDPEPFLGEAKQIDPNDKCVVIASTTHTPYHPWASKTRHSTITPSRVDYTKRPRFCDEEVELVNREDELFVMDKPVDPHAAKPVEEDQPVGGASHWSHGGGANTSHIVTHFSSDLSVLQFVRVLKSLKKKTNTTTTTKSAGNDVIKPEGGPLVNGTADGSSKPSDRKKRKSGSGATGGGSANNSSEVAVKTEEGEEQVKSEPDVDGPEDVIDRIHRLTGIVFRDPEAARSRWQHESLEDENYMKDEPSLHLTTESSDNIGRRAVCLSTIFRNLSFVPGNEYELSRNPTFLAIVGRLLLLHHWYPKRPSKQRNYDRGEEEDHAADSCTSLTSGDEEWWWDYLHVIRENVMVCLANISGALDLTPFEEDICRPILNGLLEWAVSSSAYAQDPFPNVGPNSPISPQRLAIETLCKLCLLEGNVDLMLSTPPYSRIEKLALLLAKKLYRYEEQVLREFSINLLYYLSGADSGVARTIALSDTTVGLLLGFIEQAEGNAMMVAQRSGVNTLRDNPESMGTSLDMLRRAASTLGNLSKHPDNIPLFVRQEQRLLGLVMSQILDQGVASILSHVLYNIGAQAPKAPPPLKVEPQLHNNSCTSVKVEQPLPPPPPPPSAAAAAAAGSSETAVKPV